ncbi:MAG: hypothetical protein WCX30_02065 [Candidatus Paceibacterota bacterium]|jgi:cell division protein FtsL|nr:hypothetical protein [bacterium]
MKKKKNQTKLFFLLIIVVIVTLTGLYVFQISEMSRVSYLASNKEVEIDSLKKENSGLKLSISKNKNLVSVEERIKEKGYDKVGKINYMVVSGNTVAANQKN